ncbi:hypothetical protein GCM10009773_14980 [Williamsia serinedens]
MSPGAISCPGDTTTSRTLATISATTGSATAILHTDAATSRGRRDVDCRETTYRDGLGCGAQVVGEWPATKGVPMGKRGRKKRSRKKNAANHGKRPNA